MSQDSRRPEGRQFTPQSIAAAQEKNPFARISDIVYELLEKAIFSSAIPPGSKLNISKLAEQMGVSTSPVTRAVERLEENGLRELLERQIECNSRIAEEGLSHPYGACVGATLLRHFGESASVRAQAYAAAGSDARMGGCEMPVVINSGSGNQGLTVTLPVLEYARELGKDHETVLRALLVSNLVAIRIKAAYGRLSAFCGAVSAAAGSGAAITWLRGGTETQIETTIVNTLADISGMVCDGAKASCASKIASAVGTAILASCMSMDSKGFAAGEGLVKQNVEQTIDTIGRMASEGMAETDKKILQLMQEA